MLLCGFPAIAITVDGEVISDDFVGDLCGINGGADAVAGRKATGECGVCSARGIGGDDINKVGLALMASARPVATRSSVLSVS